MEKELSKHLEGFIRKGANPNDCWDWLGGQKYGYGVYNYPNYGRQVGAHRAVYETLIGPIPIGMDLDHLCKNRQCTNPLHLEIVTRAINLQRGSTTKLTSSDVLEIRKLIKQGIKHRYIGLRYGVSSKAIWQIENGRSWRGVE